MRDGFALDLTTNDDDGKADGHDAKDTRLLDDVRKDANLEIAWNGCRKDHQHRQKICGAREERRESERQSSEGAAVMRQVLNLCCISRRASRHQKPSWVVRNASRQAATMAWASTGCWSNTARVPSFSWKPLLPIGRK